MEELKPRARFSPPAMAETGVPICDSGRVHVFMRMATHDATLL
jgi:hypothetical protein